jgi:hypothetical protein
MKFRVKLSHTQFPTRRARVGRGVLTAPRPTRNACHVRRALRTARPTSSSLFLESSELRKHLV